MILKRRLTYADIDRIVGMAVSGADIPPYPLYDDFMDKIEELAAGTGSFDLEELRQEGYREIDRQDEIHRLAELRRSLTIA